jgi:hypothetical protein
VLLPFWTPPVTWMVTAVTTAVPLVVRPLEELESTMTLPGAFSAALPETVRAPLAFGSRTKTDLGSAVTLSVPSFRVTL